MHSKDEIKKELEELSPFLANLKAKEDPFKVPTNYFDGLSDQIMGRIQEEVVVETIVEKQERVSWVDRLVEQIQLLLQPQYALSLASVVLLLVAGTYFFWPESNFNTPDLQTLTEGISEDELIQYLSTHIDEFEVNQFVDAGIQDLNIEFFKGSEMDLEEMDELMDNLLEDLDESSLEELL